MAKDDRTGSAEGPMDRLKSEARGLVGALGDRALSSVKEKLGDATGRLTDYVEGGAGPGLMAAVTGAKGMAEGKGPVRSMLGAGMKAVTEKLRGGGKSSGGKGKLKVINIIESIDVGVPIRLAYNQWTQFADFPSFTKKVEDVQQAGEDQKLNWRAQIFLSHRDWEATILEQVPDDKIIWRSKGSKGHVDGAVTFHELAPNMTRILLVLEYHPQGFFEQTANVWRAQGRRARLEFKHFRRHVMSHTLLHPEDIEGWRGVIHDGEVVKDHETALKEEQQAQEEGGEQDRGAEDYGEDRAEDEYGAGRRRADDAYGEDEEGAEDYYGEDEDRDGQGEDEYGEDEYASDEHDRAGAHDRERAGAHDREEESRPGGYARDGRENARRPGRASGPSRQPAGDRRRADRPHPDGRDERAGDRGQRRSRSGAGQRGAD